MPVLHETRKVKASEVAPGEYVHAGQFGSLVVQSAEFNGKTVMMRLRSDDGQTEITATRNPGDLMHIEVR